ncbi:MAG: hypothetical protein LBJ35_07645 [Spirochaetaceae bacterium]|jgi:hypothetical protein|nr:hypothetical protein [Spirochaetaceae bacterium]
MNATATAIRGEKGYIDAIPDGDLEMVRSILSFLAKTSAPDNPLIIETDLAGEEKAMIEAGRKERVERPGTFTPWAKVRRS